MIRVSLLDARDWSEKRDADRSIFSKGHLSSCLIRPLLKIDTHFLNRLKLLTDTIKKI
jgi:hypothetical protein